MGRFQGALVLWATTLWSGIGPEETSLNFWGSILALCRDRIRIPMGPSCGTCKDAARPHLCGLHRRPGEAYSHLETNAYTERIEDYQRMQYDRLFDGGAAPPSIRDNDKGPPRHWPRRSLAFRVAGAQSASLSSRAASSSSFSSLARRRRPPGRSSPCGT